MSAHPKAAPSYKFGPYSVDIAAGQLFKHSYKLKLAGQPFEILLMLLERPGEVVTREQIRERLWAEGTFVDFENSLNKAVNKLRQALNDSSEEPRYIETLPRRGYRFIGHLQDEDTQAQVGGSALGGSPQAAVQPRPQEHGACPELVTDSGNEARRGRTRWWIFYGAVFVAVIAIAFAVLIRRERPEPHAIASVAVLPLEYLSSDSGQQFLADGVTEELTTQLANTGSFRVTSRTSAMQFRKTSKSLPQIARELGVDAVVEGSMERIGSRLRIHTQLIRASTDEHLWAETYDGDMSDLMALEDRVAKDVATRIAIRLTPEQEARFARAHQVPPEAHIAYLQGRYFWNQRTKEGFERALKYFQSAIEKDPNYAAAYAGLADTYLLLGGYRYYSQNEMIPKAREAAQHSLQIEDSAEAHTSLALIAENYDWDWVTAEKEYRRAIELNPNYPTAHQWYGNAVLTMQGRFDEAFSELQKAADLDPLSPIIATDKGVAFFMARRYDEANRQFESVLELYPHYEAAEFYLVLSLDQKKDYAGALAVLKSALMRDPVFKEAEQGLIEAHLGHRAEAIKILQNIRTKASRQYVDAAAPVMVLSGLGQQDETLAELERAVAFHSTALTSLKVNPFYDQLRSNPRFTALMRRVNLQK